MIRRILNWCRQLRARSRGVRGVAAVRHLEAEIDWRPGIGAQGPGQIEIDSGLWMERGVVLHAYGGRIRVGRDVFVGPYAVIYGHGGVEIGDQTLISMHCRILSSNHSLPPFGTEIRSQADALLPTRIGRDVWLGAGVTVLGGVTLGEGCVVGAGAVVTKDLPPGCIALGIPATVRGWRQDAPRA